MREGRDVGFLVGIRDGVAVGMTKQRRAEPTPMGMKPALQVQTDDPTADLLLAGQGWHCALARRKPAPSNTAPGVKVFTGQATQVKPWLPVPTNVGCAVDVATACKRRELDSTTFAVGAPLLVLPGAPLLVLVGAPLLVLVGAPLLVLVGAPLFVLVGAPLLVLVGAPLLVLVGAPLFVVVGAPLFVVGAPLLVFVGAPLLVLVGAPLFVLVGAPLLVPLEGAPRFVVGAPRFVVGAPIFDVGVTALVVGAPRLMLRWNPGLQTHCVPTRRLLAGQTIRVGNMVGRPEGTTEGLGEGLTVGTRVGKGVTSAMHRKAGPIPPLELKPGRHLQDDDPGFETLFAGQRWH
jgi:hypothetical protein